MPAIRSGVTRFIAIHTKLKFLRRSIMRCGRHSCTWAEKCLSRTIEIFRRTAMCYRPRGS